MAEQRLWTERIERLLGGLERTTRPAFGAIRRPLPMQACSLVLDSVESWNARIDLTAARNPDELVDLFFADAVLLSQASAERRPGQSWIDVGSGAGAPGLSLALLAPDLELTLLEPRAKRVAFLRSVLGRLGRVDVRVTQRRSDALADKMAEVALSRATFPPAVWLAEGARLARSGVWVLLARGDPPGLPGWRVQHDISYQWPLTGVDRRALLFVPEEPWSG